MNALDGLDIPDNAPWNARALFRLLTRLDAGRLVLTTPDGVRRHFEGARAGPAAEVAIRDWSAIARMARGAEIGVFECWRDGLLATPDMTTFLALCAHNQLALEARRLLRRALVLLRPEPSVLGTVVDHNVVVGLVPQVALFRRGPPSGVARADQTGRADEKPLVNQARIVLCGSGPGAGGARERCLEYATGQVVGQCGRRR